MSNFEFLREPYPQTSLPDMDPVLRGQIVACAEDGIPLDELYEIFGPDNVELAAMNNLPLLELIERTEGADHAA